MARHINEDFRQLRLGLPDDYQDVTEGLDPLTIYVSNIPKACKSADIARVFRVAERSVQLKQLRINDLSNIAFIVPNTWKESDFILGNNEGRYLHGRKLNISQAYDQDRSMPGHRSYKIHELSEEAFDLAPACAEKPSIHCLNDYVLMHIFGYLNLKEKLRIEAVCRRWQALIYSQVGGQSTVDLNAEACPWRSTLASLKNPGNVVSPLSRSPGVNMLEKYKSVMYKILIMNRTHLTSLHLDEHRCVIELNIVSAIGRLAPHLQVLSLRFSRRRNHNPSLKDIFTHCSKLKTLCLDGIQETENLFDDLRYCRALEVLRLNGISKLNVGKKLKIPLKELSLSDVSRIGPNFANILQPNLSVFRLFNTVESNEFYARSANFNKEMLAALLKTCPDLVELQVCYDVTYALNFQSFKKLKVLQLQIDYCEPSDVIGINFPAVEDLRLEFLDTMLDMQWDELESFNFAKLLPASVKSVTLPTRTLDEASYESLLALPNLERIFFKSSDFTMAQLEKFVSRPQFVEIGAGMLRLRPEQLKALASVRRKALASAKIKAPTDSPDAAPPLVLHLPSSGMGKNTFQDPLLKVIELKGESFIYHRVGSTQFDNEWTDFSMDFLTHELGMQCDDDLAFHPDVFLVDHFHRFFDNCSDDGDPFYDSSCGSPDDNCDYSYGDDDYDDDDGDYFG